MPSPPSCKLFVFIGVHAFSGNLVDLEGEAAWLYSKVPPIDKRNTVTWRSRNLGSPRAASSTISGFDFVPSPYDRIRATSGSLWFPKLPPQSFGTSKLTRSAWKPRVFQAP